MGDDEPKETAAADGIRVYVNVTDLESTLAAAKEAGGDVRTPRAEVGGDMGWWAEIVDPGGRRVGPVQRQRGGRLSLPRPGCVPG
ncbi:MAG: VOC family protein [Mycobacteriales bacterium]